MSVTVAAGFRRDRVHTRVGTSPYVKAIKQLRPSWVPLLGSLFISAAFLVFEAAAAGTGIISAGFHGWFLSRSRSIRIYGILNCVA